MPDNLNLNSATLASLFGGGGGGGGPMMAGAVGIPHSAAGIPYSAAGIPPAAATASVQAAHNRHLDRRTTTQTHAATSTTSASRQRHFLPILSSTRPLGLKARRHSAKGERMHSLSRPLQVLMYRANRKRNRSVDYSRTGMPYAARRDSLEVATVDNNRAPPYSRRESLDSAYGYGLDVVDNRPRYPAGRRESLEVCYSRRDSLEVDNRPRYYSRRESLESTYTRRDSLDVDNRPPVRYVRRESIESNYERRRFLDCVNNNVVGLGGGGGGVIATATTGVGSETNHHRTTMGPTSWCSNLSSYEERLSEEELQAQEEEEDQEENRQQRRQLPQTVGGEPLTSEEVTAHRRGSTNGEPTARPHDDLTTTSTNTNSTANPSHWTPSLLLVMYPMPLPS